MYYCECGYPVEESNENLVKVIPKGILEDEILSLNDDIKVYKCPKCGEITYC